MSTRRIIAEFKSGLNLEEVSLRKKFKMRPFLLKIFFKCEKLYDFSDIIDHYSCKRKGSAKECCDLNIREDCEILDTLIEQTYLLEPRSWLNMSLASYMLTSMFKSDINHFQEDIMVNLIDSKISDNTRIIDSSYSDHPFNIINYKPNNFSVKSSEKITVAVIDTGVNYNHNNLKSSLWPCSDSKKGFGINLLDNGDKYDVCDDEGHGTHISGILACDDISIGVSRNIKVLNIKIFGSAKSQHLSLVCKAMALAYKLGAEVINNSYALDHIDLRRNKHVVILNSLLECLWENNCTNVFAAGQGGKKNIKNIYPQNQIEHLIVVGAVEYNNKSNKYSRLHDTPHGKDITIWAPGNLINSTSYDNDYQCKSDENKYPFESTSGASLAAPFVTAAIALLKLNCLKENKKLTNKKIKEILSDKSTVITIDNPNANSEVKLLNINKILNDE